jgi:RNA polymerase sigma factor FliA
VDEADRRRLVQEHLGLAKGVAIKIKREIAPPVELDDLIAYGTQGLLEAAERFDDKLGVAFGAFAYYRVRGAIYDGLRQFGHLPKSEYAKVKAQQRAQEYLANLNDRELGARAPGAPPVATTTEDHVRALHEAMAGVVTSFVTSLEVLAQQGQQIADPTLSPEDAAHVARFRDVLQQAIAELPDKERHFIQKHYFEDKNLQDAGQELGFTKSWASRLHARAIDLLRKKLSKLDP